MALRIAEGLAYEILHDYVDAYPKETCRGSFWKAVLGGIGPPKLRISTWSNISVIPEPGPFGAGSPSFKTTVTAYRPC